MRKQTRVRVREARRDIRIVIYYGRMAGFGETSFMRNICIDDDWL